MSSVARALQKADISAASKGRFEKWFRAMDVMDIEDLFSRNLTFSRLNLNGKIRQERHEFRTFLQFPYVGKKTLADLNVVLYPFGFSVGQNGVLIRPTPDDYLETRQAEK